MKKRVKSTLHVKLTYGSFLLLYTCSYTQYSRDKTETIVFSFLHFFQFPSSQIKATSAVSASLFTRCKLEQILPLQEEWCFGCTIPSRNKAQNRQCVCENFALRRARLASELNVLAGMVDINNPVSWNQTITLHKSPNTNFSIILLTLHRGTQHYLGARLLHYL